MRGIYLYAIAAIFTLMACAKVEGEYESSGQMDEIVFNLTLSSSEMNSRAKSSVGDDINIVYLLCDASGYVIQNINSEYRGELSQIVIEPLNIGSYTLYVMAYDKSMIEAGLVINNDIEVNSNQWFSFEGEKLSPLKSSNLLYGSRDFYVDGDGSMSIDVSLHYLLSAIAIDKGTVSPYLNNSIKNFEFVPTNTLNLNSSFSVDGQFSGAKELSTEATSVLKIQTLYFLPTSDEKQIEVDIEVETLSHDKRAGRMLHSFAAELSSNQMNRVKMDLSKHPDYNVGTHWMTFDDVASEGDNFPKILQDDEPKSIYYDQTQRSFYINEPLQIKAIEGESSISARLYSPVEMTDVTLWAQRYEGDEKIALVYLDTLPGFGDKVFSFEMAEGERTEMRTSSGKYLSLNSEQLDEYIHGVISIESSCEFWTKIQQIRAKWHIRFDSYGGDPDMPNGSPENNWMGLRPVHAREGVAMLLNAAYMLTLPDFEAELNTYQGVLYGNGGAEDIIDVSTIIPQMESIPRFKLGLIYTGDNVVGLGGGEVLGVFQASYLHHYDEFHPAETIFHEIGHCMGYGHDSSMSYGAWSEELCDAFYVGNIHRFPVYSKSILNSENSPYIY